MLTRFLTDEEGATAMEYGLIAIVIATAVITALVTVGNTLSVTFDYVATSAGSTTG